MDVFKSNAYPEDFLNDGFKAFLSNKHRIPEKVPKELLFLVLPYLGPLSLQSKTKLRKFLNGILNCCKSQIFFRVKTNEQTLLFLKISFQKNLHLVSFMNFIVDSAKNPIMLCKTP